MQNKTCLRLTRQRKIILEELRKVNSHPSADEIYAMVRKRLPRISLGTVYRNLEILSKNGEIQKLEPASTLKRFDGNPNIHYHIRCVRCERVVDAQIKNNLTIDNVISETADFKIIGHKLEFIGLCPECDADSALSM